MKSYTVRAYSDRVDRVIASNPKIPDYANRCIRVGSDSFKHDKSVDSMECFTQKKDSLTYTGDNILGIGTMHKSNAVPITKGSDMAKEIARMRR